MSINRFREGLSLEPVSADPSSPVEGQLQRSDGTHRTIGVWEYRGAAWVKYADLSSAETLINKSIDSDNNTITNIVNANIKAGAGIVESKLTLDIPTSTLDTNLTNHEADTSTHGVTTIAGLTEAQTLTDKTLTSPIINTQVTGSAVLDDDTMATASDTTVATSESIKAYADSLVAGGTGFSQPYLLSDVGLAVSMAASAVTISLKRGDGSTTPSVANPVKIGFRDTTITTGGFNIRTQSSALSMTIDSGATLGTEDTVESTIYVYAVDNVGTIELGVSSSWLDETILHSSTLLDSGADDYYTLYSDVARTNIPIKLLGSFTSTQATAGTWVTSASSVFVGNIPEIERPIFIDAVRTATSQSITAATPTKIVFTAIDTNKGDNWDSSNNRFKINEDASYDIKPLISLLNSTGTPSNAVLNIYVNGSSVRHIQGYINSGSNITTFEPTITIDLEDTDYVELYVTTSQNTSVLSSATINGGSRCVITRSKIT